MQDDEFTLVTAKKRNKAKHPKSNFIAGLELSSNICVVNKETAVRRIKLAQGEITSSEFYSSILLGFEQGFDLIGRPVIKEILCYGVGHFAESVGPRYQFGLLLALKEFFNAQVFVYDPIFYKLECDLVTEFGCTLIEENEEGKRAVNNPTLVFLPHCSKQLTNNFLWSNWGSRLKDCIILGNSFSKIVESLPKRILLSTAFYILNVNHFTEEIAITNAFKFTDIFNDSAIHFFPETKLNLIAQDLWTARDEPKYSTDDTEFILKLPISSLSITD